MEALKSKEAVQRTGFEIQSTEIKRTHMGHSTAKTKTLELEGPDAPEGKLKILGGSKSDAWNNIIANDTINCLWLKHSDAPTKDRQFKAAMAGLIGIAPRDELEGMLAAQLIACHSAAMECYRRAMIESQTFEDRRENLHQASKLSRTQVILLEALNKHRGKGQQKVTVEHVHVHSGGQAIVGNVEPAGGGGAPKSKEQPHALEHAPGAPLWSTNAERDCVPVSSNGERPVSDARRPVTWSAEGK